jgi:hypothetical protein
MGAIKEGTTSDAKKRKRCRRAGFQELFKDYSKISERILYRKENV